MRFLPRLRRGRNDKRRRPSLWRLGCGAIPVFPLLVTPLPLCHGKKVCFETGALFAYGRRVSCRPIFHGRFRGAPAPSAYRWVEYARVYGQGAGAPWRLGVTPRERCHEKKTFLILVCRGCAVFRCPLRSRLLFFNKDGSCRSVMDRLGCTNLNASAFPSEIHFSSTRPFPRRVSWTLGFGTRTVFS